MHRLLWFIAIFESARGPKDLRNDVGLVNFFLRCRASTKVGDGVGDEVGSPPPSLLNCEPSLEVMTIVIKAASCRTQRLHYSVAQRFGSHIHGDPFLHPPLML